MSFSSNVKQELAKIEDMPPCCAHAMTYGLLLFGRSFNYSGISIMTEHKCVAEKYREMISNETSVLPDFKISKAGKYTVSITDRDSMNKVFNCFSLSGNEAVMRINRGNLLNESSGDPSEEWNCCNGAFLRGAFLSCGTICDPNKGYHLEFVVPFRTLSLDLMKMLTEYDLKAKYMTRRGVNVIYLKDSESIEDLLNIMGAKNSAFEIMDIKIFKDVRNSANRKSNFSVANISRTVKASYDQVEAFQKLIDDGAFDKLDDEMKHFIRLRIENPDASLRELGEMYTPPLSRSAVNYKIKKIMAFYDKTYRKDDNKTQPEE
ncbi:MAG: DNA-binding protein WhiA [Acutalibacteraceae bacterium]